MTARGSCCYNRALAVSRSDAPPRGRKPFWRPFPLAPHRRSSGVHGPVIGRSSKPKRDTRSGSYPSGMGLETIVLIQILTGITAPWRALFDHSAPVEMSVVGVHVLSMLIAGGLAIAYDRGTLRADRWGSALREHHFAELHAVHRTVVAALAICMLSGLALFASDVKTYVGSVPFWIKMALIAMLLLNALVMTANEGTVRSNAGGEAVAAWARIRTSSIVSVFLWGSIVLVSIVLSLSR
jgi:hypothetical protein